MRLIERLRIALFGRQLSDAIKPDVDALTARVGAIRGECQAALDAAAAFRARTLQTSHIPESVPANLTALGNVLEAFDGHEARINQMVAEFHDAEHALDDRIGDLAGLYRTPETSRARLMEEIAAIRRPALDLHVRFLRDFMSLERLWQQWSPGEERALQQDSAPRRKRA